MVLAVRRDQRSGDGDQEEQTSEIRFGCHDFLNAKPLIIPLLQGELNNPFRLVFDTPANLARMLSEGKLDLAAIPSIEYARIGGLSLINKFSISSLGRVDTVLLFTKKQRNSIRTVAVDTSSRTSVAMLKILMAERFGIDPEFLTCQPDTNTMMKQADAGLIIGDNAFRISRKEYTVYDLGEEWFRLTGKPFVHAVIAVRDGRSINGVDTIIREAMKIGLTSLEKIAEEESKRVNITPKDCLDYLKNRIRYRFEEEEIEGLKEFYRLAKKHQIIDCEPQIKFYDTTHTR